MHVQLQVEVDDSTFNLLRQLASHGLQDDILHDPHIQREGDPLLEMQVQCRKMLKDRSLENVVEKLQPSRGDPEQGFYVPSLELGLQDVAYEPVDGHVPDSGRRDDP